MGLGKLAVVDIGHLLFDLMDPLSDIICSGGSRISRRGGVDPLGGGRGPLIQALFGENVYENERIGSHRGWRAPGTPPRSANDLQDYLTL